MAFTLLYGIIALSALSVVTVAVYLIRGWKAALIAFAITLLGLVVVFFGLITLITRNM